MRYSGRRVVALDQRGHGASTKFYAPGEYSTPRMAGDLLALLDRLSIDRADLIGYDMGARTAVMLAVAHPERVRSLTLAGIGMNLVEGSNRDFRFAAALEAAAETVTDPMERRLREFAEENRCDLKAVAACFRGARPVAREQLAKLRIPTLIVAGTEDELALAEPGTNLSAARALARLVPGAKALDLPGRDNYNAIGDQEFMQAVIKFLARRP